MKIKKKFLIILLLVNVLIMLAYFNNFEATATDLKSIESQAEKFIEKGIGDNDLSEMTGSITKNFIGLGQMLTMIGAGVMVIVVSYMGIKYLISPPDKQAALKQQLIGVVVSGIVIFGAYGIWSAVLGVVSKFD